MREAIKNNLVTVIALGMMGLISIGGLSVMAVIAIVTALSSSCPVG